MAPADVGPSRTLQLAPDKERPSNTLSFRPCFKYGRTSLASLAQNSLSLKLPHTQIQQDTVQITGYRKQTSFTIGTLFCSTRHRYLCIFPNIVPAPHPPRHEHPSSPPASAAWSPRRCYEIKQQTSHNTQSKLLPRASAVTSTPSLSFWSCPARLRLSQQASHSSARRPAPGERR